MSSSSHSRAVDMSDDMFVMQLVAAFQQMTLLQLREKPSGMFQLVQPTVSTVERTSALSVQT
eukprot:3335678-Amphidinium_carterae.1